MAMVDRLAQPIWAFGDDILGACRSNRGRPYAGERRLLKREAIKRSRRYDAIAIGDQLGELVIAVPRFLEPEAKPVPRLHRGLHAFVRARHTS